MPVLAANVDPSIIIGEKITELIKAIPELPDNKVHFARGYEIGQDELPCVSIEIGPDTPTDPDGIQTSSYIDSLQDIFVDIYDQAANTEGIRRITNRRALCHFAIMSDYTLGLAPLVIQARYGGASEPLVDAESGLPGWTIRLRFVVHYRCNEIDRTIIS